MPIRLRSAQQKMTANVQTGCISCCSGDGKFGGPLWWNTPMGDEEEEGDDENRQARRPREAETGGTCACRSAAFLLLARSQVWGQVGVDDGPPPPSRKRPAPEAAAEPQDEEDDDMPEEVKRRLAALKDDWQKEARPRANEEDGDGEDGNE